MAVLRVAWAAWAGWTCKNLSKEVSIPQATLDSLYITVKGSWPATPAQPRKTRNKTPYSALSNKIPLEEMNKPATTLSGKAKKYAELSSSPMFAKIDSGDDDLLNRIIWYATMGDKPYPKKMTLPKKLREDNDD